VAHVQRLFPASLQVRVSNFDTAIKKRKVHYSAFTSRTVFEKPEFVSWVRNKPLAVKTGCRPINIGCEKAVKRKAKLLILVTSF